MPISTSQCRSSWRAPWATAKCTATRRVIAVGDVRDQLVERMIDAVKALRVGDGMDPNTGIGPIVAGAPGRGRCGPRQGGVPGRRGPGDGRGADSAVLLRPDALGNDRARHLIEEVFEADLDRRPRRGRGRGLCARQRHRVRALGIGVRPICGVSTGPSTSWRPGSSRSMRPRPAASCCRSAARRTRRAMRPRAG